MGAFSGGLEQTLKRVSQAPPDPLLHGIGRANSNYWVFIAAFSLYAFFSIASLTGVNSNSASRYGNLFPIRYFFSMKFCRPMV